jgi:hypothetical protein
MPVTVTGIFAEHFTLLPDALNGEYTNYMAPFAADSTNTLVNLRDCLLNAKDSILKVMLCMMTDDPLMIRVIHTPFAIHLLWEAIVLGQPGLHLGK